MWSVEVARTKSKALYHALVGLLRDGLPADFFVDITDDSRSERRKTDLIELVPGKYVRQYASTLSDLLDAHLEAEMPSWYAWKLIKPYLAGCALFVSWDSLLIRPFIPPTLSHAAFSRANQRVYMSATLGAGGELERIIGVKSIQRLPLPTGWDKRGSGRRLFLIPQSAMSDEDAMHVVMNAMQDFERSLILTPSQKEATDFIAELRKIGLSALTAPDIEDSIEPFTSSAKSALVLSRYDGLDLPDDACRLLVLGGLPSGTNLQERFLWSRIAASSLLRDRVLTRFTQGVGRCTRSDNDYAAVLVWGRPLVDFILKHENRSILNPEIQAALEFGIENCKDKKIEDFKGLWQAFISQGEGWRDAEEAIVSLRERMTRRADPTSRRLCSVVGDEISYLYAVWNGNFETALEHARKVADTLGGDETKGYRGWWYYLAADAAMALHEANGENDFLETAKDCLKRASACCVAISWFSRLARSAGGDAGLAEVDEITAVAVESLRDKLAEWGAVGSRFEREVAQALKNIQATDHKQFHQGLKRLGEMLGFQSDLPNGNGAPDCIWSIGSDIYVVHEAKSNHTPGNPISIDDVQQAQGHENWLRANRPWSEGTEILCLIESPRETVDADAVLHAKSLCHTLPEQMKTLIDEIADVLRRVRAMMLGMSDEKVLEHLYREVRAAKLTPREVIKRLSNQLVSKMATSKGSPEKKGTSR
jgi:Helicase C-terminal domain